MKIESRGVRQYLPAFGLLAVLLLSACAANGWKSVSSTWVGKDMGLLKQHWGEPDRHWIRADGKQIHQYHLEQIDPTCNQYWVVGDSNRIEDYYFEGDCEKRPLPGR